MQDLLRRREQLVKQRTQDMNRLDKAVSADAQASAQRHIARLEEAYQALLRSVPALSKAADLYRSVPGVGLLTASTLVAELPEPGRCAGKALAALTAVMRKLVLHLNAIAVRTTPWTPQPARAG